MSEYSTGRFRVYYLNTAGHEVPLANARYQILSEENVVVASGRTNSQGQTDAVRVEVKSRIRVAARDSFANSAGLVGLAVRAMLSSPDKLRYSLKLQVPGSQEFERPDYNVNQERYWLEISALRRENIVFGVRVNPYFRVQLRAGGGGQATPISGVDYIAYSGTTSDGRRIVATSPDGEQIRGRTDGHGRTGKHFYAGELQFEFALPGNLRRQTVPLKPLFKGGQYAIYHFDIGSQTARTERDRGATAHVSGMMGQPLVLVPDKDEALILPPEAWEELRALSNTIEGTMSAVHSARLNLNQALAANSAKAVEDAERALGIAEDHVAEMLNKDFSSTADLCEVITIENFDHGRTRGNGSFLDRVGWRRRYIPQKKYEELKRRRVRGVPIHVEMSTSVKAKNGGQSVAGESKQTPTNSRGFDAQAFMQSMQNLKVEYEKKVDMDPRVVNLIDAFKNEYSNAARHSAQYSTESSAQWLRFVAGAGASAKGQVNLANGRLNGRAQGNAQAKLVLLEGSYRIVYEVPSYKGWQMHFSGQDLGAIIFELSCVFSGFVGAKVALTGAVEVSYEGNRAKVSPRQRDRNDRLSVNFDEKSGLPRAELDRARVVPARLNERPPEDMNGVEVKAEAFAGIEVGLEPSGQLKWLPPENRRQPVAFASLTLDVAVNAGAAASAQLTIYYLQGKFRIKVMARLCWGIGAKGALDFVVDAAGLFEFARWVFCQLAHAAFINLTYIAHNAFLAHSRLMYLLIVDGVGVNENSAIAQFLVGNSAAIARRLDEFQARLNRASERKKLVDAINALPEWLTYATPETRGMLLYSITRHYPETHSRNLPSLGGSLSNPEVQYLPEHKQAILNVMRAVSLRREWANVMEHMTEDGRKRADAGKAEGDVLRFLNYGYSLNPNLSRIFDDINSHPEWRPRAGEAENTYLQQYLEHRANLRERFPRGYQVAQYGTPEYEEMLALETDRLPEFAVLEPRWGEEDTGYA